MNFVARVSRTVVDHPDRLSGMLILFLAAFAWLEAFHLPFGSIHAPDAGFFPQVLSVLLFLTSIAILAHSFSREVQATEFSRRSWLVPIAAAVLVAYALVLPSVGFVLATAAVMLLIMRGLVKMRWSRALLISIPTVVLSYLAFIKLGVPLPQGPLPF
jgi:putative tricarboxylic transport membrane protein